MENLGKKLVNAKEKIEFEKPTMSLDVLMKYGNMLVEEQVWSPTLTCCQPVQYLTPTIENTRVRPFRASDGPCTTPSAWKFKLSCMHAACQTPVTPGSVRGQLLSCIVVVARRTEHETSVMLHGDMRTVRVVREPGLTAVNLLRYRKQC